MFDLIFEMVCSNEYYVMVIYKENDTLYAVPCEDCMSGYYPVSEKRFKLSECKINIKSKTCNAIICIKNGNNITIRETVDTWDGYQ